MTDPTAIITLALIGAFGLTSLLTIYVSNGIAKARRGFGWRAKDQVARLVQIRDWLFYLFVGFAFVCLMTLWVIEAGTPDQHRPNPPTEVEVS